MERKSSIEEVISNDFCIGCGACCYPASSPFRIHWNQYGKYEAIIDKKEGIDKLEEYSKVCPFSDESTNESLLAEDIFKDCKKDSEIGAYLGLYAGHINDETQRSQSSSGGLTSWILEVLLATKYIDGVYHVKPNKGNKLFKYALSTTINEIKDGAKTRYYPIEMSEILKEVESKNGKFAIVGLPCFIKAIRLLQNEHPILKEKITFCIGLVCGHLKSSNFADLWAWQLDIKPSQLTNIDFRTKLKNQTANNYGVSVESIDKYKVSESNYKLYGSNWGWGFFKYKACDYCDDIFSECADITLGDAWLPEFINDAKGTNIIIVRNKTLHNLLKIGIEKKTLLLEELALDKIKESQSSGIFHRRDALYYRLSIGNDKKTWIPKKRKFPYNTLTKKQKKIQDLRLQIAEKSSIEFAEAIEKDSLPYFYEQMTPLTKQYQNLYKRSIYKKILTKILSLWKA